MGKLSENQNLYEELKTAIQNIYTEIHAVYEPEDAQGWHSAAVDLFEPGLTFRIYFTIEDGKLQIKDMKRWWFG